MLKMELCTCTYALGARRVHKGENHCAWNLFTAKSKQFTFKKAIKVKNNKYTKFVQNNFFKDKCFID